MSADIGTASILLLGSDDVNYRTAEPSPAFVAAVASRVVRCGDVNKPGYVMIANPKHILRSRKKVLTFQKSLLRALDRHISTHFPEAVRLQDFLDISEAEAKRVYRKCRRRSGIEIGINGMHSNRMFHMDFLSQLFVSLCYYRRSSIAGGNPQILDVLRMAKEVGASDVEQLQDTVRLSAEDQVYHKREFAVYLKLKPEYRHLVTKFTTRFVNIPYGTAMPIVVFSNRREDGIMHGATPVRRMGRNPSRSLSYVSIGYV